MNFELRIIYDDLEKRKAMCICDSAFDEPLCVSSKGDFLMEKICKNAFFICAYCSDEVVGYCAMYANDYSSQCAYITMLAIQSEFQRMGIGKLLVDFAIDVAMQHKMIYLRLEVKDTNTKAISFYIKNGFKYTGEKNDFGGSYMIKELCV